MKAPNEADGDSADPYQDLKEFLRNAQGQLDQHDESEVVVAVPDGILGVFPDSDAAYLAAIEAVGIGGRYLMRAARGSRRGTIAFPLSVGPPPSTREVLQKVGLVVPGPRRVTGFLDTGADSTMIRPSLAADLALPQVNSVVAQTVNGDVRVPMVLCEFAFPGGLSFTLRVGVTDGFRQEASVLVGMDIMKHARIVAEDGRVSFGLLRKPY